MLERLGVILVLLLDTHDDVAVHLDEATVAVVGEAAVAGQLLQALDGLVVETQVEDGVHHTRHRLTGAGTDGHEERVLDVTELLAGLLLDLLDRGGDLGFENLRVLALVRCVVVADLSGDGEASRHIEAAAAHLTGLAPLPPSSGFSLIAVGLTASKK